MSNSFLNGANMTGANFANSVLVHNFMRSTNMSRACFRSSLFDDCDVADATIEGTDFRMSKLIMTDLRQAKVTSFDIRGADLEKAFWDIMLRHALDALKKEGPDNFNAPEIVKTYQLLQKATYDKETSVSQTLRDIVEYMTQETTAAS